jgi:hypothetical protein
MRRRLDRLFAPETFVARITFCIAVVIVVALCARYI